jgi:DNA-binding NarL/FixJ family response regulator
MSLVNRIAGSGVMNVFIAEDQAWFLEQLTQIVVSVPGAKVIGSADTAEAAVDAIRVHRPDVALIDLMLREGTGFEVLRRLRGEGISGQLLVVTSFPTAGIKKVCLLGGADGFFDKLLELDKLSAKLESIAATLN